MEIEEWKVHLRCDSDCFINLRWLFLATTINPFGSVDGMAPSPTTPSPLPAAWGAEKVNYEPENILNWPFFSIFFENKLKLLKYYNFSPLVKSNAFT